MSTTSGKIIRFSVAIAIAAMVVAMIWIFCGISSGCAKCGAHSENIISGTDGDVKILCDQCAYTELYKQLAK